MRSIPASRISLLIFIGALCLFTPGLGAVHLFDWDEINFAEIAREMLVGGDWSRPQIDFQPFHEKPPLFMWMQAISMSMFGVGEFAARFPNALCGAITLLLLFRIGARERGYTFGLLWVLAYMGSILPNLYFRSGIIDPWFNLFIFLGLYAFIRSVREHAWTWSVLSGALLGLAVMTKGPAAIIILGITGVVYWTSRRFAMFFELKHLGILLLSLLCVVSLWFGMDFLRNGPAFSVAFFERQVALFTEEDAGHGGFAGYHFVVLLIGCFPSSLFAVQELMRPTRGTELQNDLRRWLLILFWVVLILFSIVNTKIVHYSSLCYFPLTYLAALQMERIWQQRETFIGTRSALDILGSGIAVVFMAAPYIGMHPELLRPLLASDPFAQANLDAPVNWSGLEALAGVWLLGTLLAAHFLHASGRVRASLVASFGGTAIFISLTLALFINRIENYSQRAAVNFFSSHVGERCWLMTKGYKSYVPPFYGRTTEARPDETILLSGPIDRPVFLACKLTDVGEVLSVGTFIETGRANGFVFFRRDP